MVSRVYVDLVLLLHELQIRQGQQRWQIRIVKGFIVSFAIDLVGKNLFASEVDDSKLENGFFNRLSK